MLDSPTISVLQTALDYASVRQDTLANNIANINTPGFHRKEASFSSVLAAANPVDMTVPLAAERDNAAHMAFPDDAKSGVVGIDTPNDGAMRLDGNNVDMDVEMGRLAKNQIYFQGLTQLMAGQFTSLKYVITSK